MHHATWARSGALSSSLRELVGSPKWYGKQRLRPSRPRPRWPWRTDRAAAWPGCSAWPALGRPRAVDPVAVALPGRDAGQVAVPAERVDLRQLDRAVSVPSSSNRHSSTRVGDLGEQREVGAARRRRWRRAGTARPGQVSMGSVNGGRIPSSLSAAAAGWAHRAAQRPGHDDDGVGRQDQAYGLASRGPQRRDRPATVMAGRPARTQSPVPRLAATVTGPRRDGQPPGRRRRTAPRARAGRGSVSAGIRRRSAISSRYQASSSACGRRSELGPVELRPRERGRVLRVGHVGRVPAERGELAAAVPR